jgi:hypothetical protein
MVYKFTKIDNTFFYQDFTDVSAAQSFVNGVERMQIEQTANFSTIPSVELLESDKSFLLFMMDRFVYLNRQDNITPEESSVLLTQFNSIKQLSDIGRVYTVARQTEDLELINKYAGLR